MEKIIVQAVTKKERKYNNQTIWGVKVGEDAEGNDVWYNLYTNIKPSKGQGFTVEVTESTGNDGRIFRDARIAQGTQAAPTSAPLRKDEFASSNGNKSPVVNGGRATPYTQSFEVYAAVARAAHALATELEPDNGSGGINAHARTALVSTFLIALGEGKLTMTVEDEWNVPGETGRAAVPGARVKQAKNAAHDHLASVLNDAAALMKTDAIALLRKYGPDPDISDVVYLTEKEAINTRLTIEKFIDENTDWRADLSVRIKAYCLLKKMDFTKERTDILLAVAGTRDFKTIDQATAKKAIETLKEKYRG